MKKVIKEGEMIPKFYGLAYLEYDRHAAVCYPIPLNKIVGLLRKIHHWFMAGHTFETGYDKGFEVGRQHGIRMGMDQTRSKVSGIVKRFMEVQSAEFKKPQLTAGWIIDFIKSEEDKLK